MSASKVMCVGLVTLDHMMQVDRVPLSNQKVVARSASFDFGGPAANAAAAASALGSEAMLVTVIGDSALTQHALSGLSELGVDVIDLASPASGAPSVSTVLITVSTGDRAVISQNGRSAPPAQVPPQGLLDEVSLLLVDGHHMETAILLARRAQARGVFVIFDGGSWKPGTEELLEHVDFAVVSDDFIPPDGSDPLPYLISAGCQAAAQSRGAAPIRFFDGGGEIEVPVPVVEEPVDTLGAGDVLHGALAHFLRERKERSALPVALERSAAVASESCRHTGAHGWIDALRRAKPGRNGLL